jgi:hypothetical protein
MSPGHEMQGHGSVKGQPGASGYAPAARSHSVVAEAYMRSTATAGSGVPSRFPRALAAGKAALNDASVELRLVPGNSTPAAR